MIPAQIIYLNGPSSSGKTTIARALQAALDPPFLHIGIDHVIGMMPAKCNNLVGESDVPGFSWKRGEAGAEIQTGPFGEKMVQTLKALVLTLAGTGHRVIVDDVSFGMHQVDEWRKALRGHTVLWVGINAPLHVLEAREQARGNRMPSSSRAQAARVHDGVAYDLEFDTSKQSLESIVQAITSWRRPPEPQQDLAHCPITEGTLPDEIRRQIFSGFGRHASEVTGLNGVAEEPVSFEIFNRSDFVGAVVVQPFWDHLHIKYLFVEKKYRGQGVGRRLMEHALNYGKKRNCKFVFVETMSFQAPAFYEKLGFVTDFVRTGLARGTALHGLKKTLEKS